MSKVLLILADPNDLHVQSVLEHAKLYPSWSYIVLDTAKALTNLNI